MGHYIWERIDRLEGRYPQIDCVCVCLAASIPMLNIIVQAGGVD